MPMGTWRGISSKVKQREYEIQRIDGLPSSLVTPSDDSLKRINRENRLDQKGPRH